MIDLCVVKCDENEVKKKSKEIVEGLNEIYDNFNDSLIKEIRVEESVFGIRAESFFMTIENFLYSSIIS
ncbi:hypothetical protein AB1303_13570 [Saccharolobus solfataricus]